MFDILTQIKLRNKWGAIEKFSISDGILFAAYFDPSQKDIAV